MYITDKRDPLAVFTKRPPIFQVTPITSLWKTQGKSIQRTKAGGKENPSFVKVFLAKNHSKVEQRKANFSRFLQPPDGFPTSHLAFQIVGASPVRSLSSWAITSHCFLLSTQITARLCPVLPQSFCPWNSLNSTVYCHPQSLWGELKFLFFFSPLSRLSPTFPVFTLLWTSLLWLVGRLTVALNCLPVPLIATTYFSNIGSYRYIWAFLHSSKNTSDWTMCPDKNADPMPCLPRNTVCSFLVEEKHS